MRIVRAIAAVFAFECRRAIGWRRGLLVLGLASFPAAILWLIRHQGGQLDQQEAWPLALFVLIPELVCLLGLLLWITPLVQTEVEGKTWPYLAVRPAGKLPVLLGKYAAGVFWTMLTGWVALALAAAVLLWPLHHGAKDPLLRKSLESMGLRANATEAEAEAFYAALTPEDKARANASVPTPAARGLGLPVWKTLAGLVAFSSMAYGALFSLLGVVFLRRGMMVAVAYTLIEFIVRIIPAVIRQITVQYHLQSLLVYWMHWDGVNREMEPFFGSAAPWENVAVLVGYTVALLAVTAAILRLRELVTAAETP
jgi:hypothetical protein